MIKRYLIGIDIGTSGCKSLLIDDRGSVIAKAVEAYPLSTPKSGWSEQDPEDWWRAAKATLRRLLKNVDRIEEIRGIGLSGQMHGLVALDRNSRVLRPAILWNDQRTARQCQEIYDRVGGITGLLQLTHNRMLPGYTGGKILWIREHEPHLFEKVRRILNPKDFIRFRLTGEFATEVSDGSGTGLFNVKERQWSRPLLEALDIPKEWLPACYESHEISGRLNRSVSGELGLPLNLPVAGGGGDAVVQTTGTGLVAPGILGTTIGTAGNVAMALDQCLENPGGKLQVFCNTMPGKWHAMGVTLSAGGALRWFRDTFGLLEKDSAERTGKDPYDILNQEASHAPAGSEGLLFLPYLIGERCPHTDPDAKGVFVGLTLRHDRSHLIRSILEGVIFSLRDVTELIKETGIPIRQVRTSGGGALSDLWRQIHADIFNCEVITVSGSGEGGAYGAALVAGTGTGFWPTVEESVKHLRIETRTLPDPKNVDRYQRLFEMYRGLYPALKPGFDQMATLNQMDQGIEYRQDDHQHTRRKQPAGIGQVDIEIVEGGGNKGIKRSRKGRQDQHNLKPVKIPAEMVDGEKELNL